MIQKVLHTKRILLIMTCAGLTGCVTPKGDFKFDLEQAAFVADVGFKALDYKAEAKKQAYKAKHAKTAWLRDWSETQQARKERLAKEQYERIKDDLHGLLGQWKAIRDELETLGDAAGEE